MYNRIVLYLKTARRTSDFMTTHVHADTTPTTSTRTASRALTESVHARLRDAIMSAELRPNRRLVENELAAWLGVSRTPVREALLRLEQEGHVARARGWIVREYAPEDIRERLECRLAIEGYAAKLAAERRTQSQVDELWSMHEAMVHPGTPRQKFNELNDAFHHAITAAAVNPMLSAFHAQTKMNYWDLSFPVVFSPEDAATVTGQHAELVDAIEARDGERAERIAREHVRLTLRVILAELELRYRGFRR